VDSMTVDIRMAELHPCGNVVLWSSSPLLLTKCCLLAFPEQPAWSWTSLQHCFKSCLNNVGIHRFQDRQWFDCQSNVDSEAIRPYNATSKRYQDIWLQSWRLVNMQETTVPATPLWVL
jgi:hypothetical protein